MTLTRWKMLAGVFGVSACGLAAVAGNPAAPKGKPACEPAVYAVPAIIPQQMPGPDAPPAITPVEHRVPEVPAKLPVAGVSTPGEYDSGLTQSSPHYLKHFPQYFPPDNAQPVVPPVVIKDESAVPPAKFLQDVAATGEPVAQPVPVMTLPPAPQACPTPPAPVPVVAPAPVPAYIPPPPASAFIPEVVPAQTVAPVVTAKPVATPEVAPVAATAPADRKLKVTLQIGDTLPKFDIRDGDEVLLKVVADKVDVASPKQRSELWATLKASGRVKFVTPGGEGVCDELQVVPGSGEVVAVGSVKFSYNWGKVETAVTSERMTFRLGNAQPLTHAPAPAPAPVVTPVSANTQPVKQVFSSYVGWIGGQ